MSHNHHHHRSSKNIRFVFFLNLTFTIFEIVGGFYVNSIAIISDAIHDLGDSISLGFSWYLQEKSSKPATKKFSYGYKRLSLLGALINSVVLLVGSTFVVYNAINRIMIPQYSDAKGMFFFALFGVLVNGYAAWKISHGKTLNEKVLSWHLMEDVLGWLAVLIVSIVLQFVNTPYLDPALSLLITAYILWNIVKRLKETLELFLQANPKDIDIKNIEEQLLKIHQIASLHHTHVWSLDGEHHVFSTHVKLHKIDDLNDMLLLKKNIKQCLKTYPFDHVTIETELENEPCHFEKNE